jgi:hypothetical protein
VITLTTLRSLRIQKREREKKIVFKIDYSKQLKVEIAAFVVKQRFLGESF